MAINIANKDLNLLFVFEAIWHEKNLTKAAKRLCITQPAVSHSLKKLREQFEDPLFVRSSGGVVPTEVAKKLAPKVQGLIQDVKGIYPNRETLSLKEEERDLRIAIGDHFAMTLFPKFLERVKSEAPKVKFIVKPVTETFPLQDVEQGETDLVLSGFYATARPPEGFHKKKVFEEPFCCVLRKKHPLARKEKKFSAYLKAEHMYVSPIGDLHGFIDVDLAKQKKKRRTTASFLGFPQAGPTLASSDLVLTAPKGLCDSLAKVYDLVTYELPVKIRPYRSVVLWHDRTHQDPLLSWVRQVIFEEFGEM